MVAPPHEKLGSITSPGGKRGKFLPLLTMQLQKGELQKVPARVARPCKVLNGPLGKRPPPPQPSIRFEYLG